MSRLKHQVKTFQSSGDPAVPQRVRKVQVSTIPVSLSVKGSGSAQLSQRWSQLSCVSPKWLQHNLKRIITKSILKSYIAKINSHGMEIKLSVDSHFAFLQIHTSKLLLSLWIYICHNNLGHWLPWSVVIVICEINNIFCLMYLRNSPGGFFISIQLSPF